MVALRYMRISSASEDTASVLSLEDILAFTAGIMSMVSVCELLPEAWNHMHSTSKGNDRNKKSIDAKIAFASGIFVGIFVMVVTEWILE
eukprot:CAMPEP_0194349662 /NCGR_PEP_ID=MMETSP0171-20130528/107211_1 /TAXON_ID=218684 /ORGANISM="Corethron pennatum, Strain L29A3" /LENGTH=88 /DNA_ID=CAMNT_0039117135 /DNA_START=826 /DNA_END=1092 /DNA_ORIENTATION=+